MLREQYVVARAFTIDFAVEMQDSRPVEFGLDSPLVVHPKFPRNDVAKTELRGLRFMLFQNETKKMRPR